MTSQKHNPFKYKNFADRVQNVNINVYQFLTVDNVLLNSTTELKSKGEYYCYFLHLLNEYKELDYTETFTKFYYEVLQYVYNLPLLILNKDKVIEIFLHYFAIPIQTHGDEKIQSSNSNTYIYSILDLLVVLVKELRYEIYTSDNITKLLLALIRLIQIFVKDTVLLEKIFNTIASIFHYLFKYMITDIDIIYDNCFRILLSNKKLYIRKFSSEVMAFLLRKSESNLINHLNFILSSLSSNNNLLDGISYIFFYVFKSGDFRLSAHFESVFKPLAQNFLFPQTQAESDTNNIYTVFILFIKLISSHIKQKSSDLLWNNFADLFKYINNSTTDNNDNKYIFFERLLNLYCICISYRNGILITDSSFTILNSIKVFLEANHPKLNSVQYSKIFQFVIEIINSMYIIQPHSIEIDKFLKIFLKLDEVTDVVITFLLRLQKLGIVFTPFSELISDYVNIMAERKEYSFYALLTTWINVENTNSKDNFLCENKISSLVKNSLFSKPNEDVFSSKCILIIWLSLKLLPRIINDLNSIKDILMSFLQWFSPLIPSSSSSRTSIDYLYNVPLSCFVSLRSIAISLLYNCESYQYIEKDFSEDSSHPQVLELFISKKDNLDEYSIENFAPFLTYSLTSPLPASRKLGCNLLEIIYPDFHICSEIININVSQNFKLFTQKLLNFENLFTKIPQKYLELTVSFLFGLYHTSYSKIWPSIHHSMILFSEKHPKIFWKVFSNNLAYSTKYSSIFIPPSVKLNEMMDISSELREYFDKVFSEINPFNEDSLKSILPKPEIQTFDDLLWELLDQIPSFIQKNITSISKLFFSFVHDEFESINSLTNLLPKTISCDIIVDSKRLVNKKLLNQIKVLSKASNLTEAQQIRPIISRILSKNDPNIQKLALKCLKSFHFSPDFLTPYYDHLFRLIDENTFREEITAFSLVAEDGIILKEHRLNLLEIIEQILYSKTLSSKHGSIGKLKSTVSARRFVVLSYLSSISNEEIEPFINLILQPFEFVDKIDNISSQRKLGFLNLFGGFLIYLPRHSYHFLSRFSKTLFSLFEENSLTTGKKKISRSLILRRIASLFENFGADFDFSGYLTTFWKCIRSDIENITDALVSRHVSAFMECLLSCSHHLPLIVSLISYDNGYVANRFINSLSFPQSSDKAIKNILDFLSGIIIFWKSPLEIPVESFSLIDGFLKNNLKFIFHTLRLRIELYFSRAKSIKENRKTVYPEKELLVASDLSQIVEDQTTCEEIVALLISIIVYPKVPDELITNSLLVLDNLVHLFSNTLSKNVFKVLNPLFYQLHSPSSRNKLCLSFTKLASILNISSLANLLSNMNSLSSKVISEPDFQRRSDAHNMIPDFFEQIPRYDKDAFSMFLSPLFYTLLYDLSNEELSIRAHSSLSLTRVIEFISKFPEFSIDIIKTIICPILFTQLKNPIENVRKSVISLFSLLVKHFPEQFQEFLVLFHEDSEADFWSNILHVQTHRRIRCLKRLQTNISNISPNLVSVFLIPVVVHFIYDNDNALIEEAINTIGIFSSLLSWGKYYRLLQSFLIKMQSADKEKLIIKVVCSILDHFPFKISSDDPIVEPSIAKIKFAIEGKIIPKLYSHAFDKNKNEMRVRVITLICKFLKLLPVDVFQKEFPKLILTISSQLANRLISIRKIGNSTLVEIVLSVGPKWMGLILSSLQTTLKRGYQRVALFHAILIIFQAITRYITNYVGNSQIWSVGDIDYCLPSIITILTKDLFEELIDNNNINSVDTNSFKDGKSRLIKSVESFRLVTQLVDFKHILILIDPIKSQILHNTYSYKMYKLLQNILSKILTGLKSNHTATPPHLLILSNMLINQYFNEEKRELKEKTIVESSSKYL